MTAGADSVVLEHQELDPRVVRRVALEIARRRWRRSLRRVDKAIEDLDRALTLVHARLEQLDEDEATYLEGMATVARELREEETAWTNT